MMLKQKLHKKLPLMLKADKTKKHLFSIYYDEMSIKHKISVGAVLVITDLALVHRVTHVLRLLIGQEVLFFDSLLYIRASIDSFSKESVRIIVKELCNNVTLKPRCV